MRIIYSILGVILLGAGLVMMASDPRIHLWWPVIEIGAILSGGIFINRAVTNRSLFGTLTLQHVITVVNSKKRWQGIAGTVCLVISVLIPVLGSDNYFGYNKTHITLVVASNLVVGILGACFLWQYLRYLKKPKKEQTP